MDKRKLRSSKKNSLLIPSNVIDAVSQRLFVISIFVLIQAWKIYDIILLKNGLTTSGILGFTNNQFSFVLKYFIVDGLFLWSLPILNIPYLTFSPLVTSLQIFVLSSITLLFASNTTIPIGSVLLPIWKHYFDKEVTLSGQSMNSHLIHDMNSHFKGKHIVNFLPDSSAKFNPFNQRSCLGSDTFEEISVPIELNGTLPGYLQLQHISPQNEATFINLTSTDIKRLLKKDYSHLTSRIGYKRDESITYIEVPLNKPGLYRITKVTDKKNLNIRSYKSNFLLPNCPSVKFNPQTAYHDKCLNDPVNDLSVQVVGVPPLSVKLSSHKNGVKQSDLSNDLTITPEGFDSPLLIGSSLTSKFLKDLTWLDSEEISTPIEQKFDIPGVYKYRLLTVVDGLGNELTYNPSSRHPDLFREYTIHGSPIVSLSDSSNVPLKIGKSKNLLVNIPDGFKQEDSPYTVDIAYLHPYDPSKNYNFTSELVNSNMIQVDKQGTYILTSVRTKYCPCGIGSDSVYVPLALEPTVNISAEAIVDECVGTTGYKFDFEFSGMPPYQIGYEVYRNRSNVITRMEKQDKLLQTSKEKDGFVYRPPSEGSYIVKFSKLQDKYYRIPLNKEEHSYHTYFKQKSKAFFRNVPSFSGICLGSSVNIPLTLEGNSPFSVKYDLINSEGKSQSFHIQNITDPVYQIITPNLDKGGVYYVKLINVSDNSKCEVEFKTQDIRIDVRSDIPKMNLKNANSEITIVEGDSVSLPLELTSSVNGNSNLVYKFTDKNGRSSLREIKNMADLEKTLRVREEGTYSLHGLTQNRCGGVVDESESITIKFYEKPSLSLDRVNTQTIRESDKYVDNRCTLDSVCVHHGRQASLDLVGKAPFKVVYDVRYPNGRLETRAMELDSHKLKVDLMTSSEGRYEYTFKEIFDQYYQESKKSEFTNNNFKPVSVIYDIHPQPDAVFIRKNKVYKTCKESAKDSLVPIGIKLSGQPPFSLELSIHHEINNKTETKVMTGIQDTNYELVEIYKGLSLGNHVISIIEVNDANGCQQRKFSELNSAIIVISDVPEIHKSIQDKNYYCVGDYISYDLKGSPPFSIFYSFNGVKQKADTISPFRRLAAKPGELNILGLSDDTSNCFVNFTKPEMSNAYADLSLRVYDLPSVEVDQGDYVVQDIYEGDQAEVTFSFKGIPPFTLTYTRTVYRQASKKGKKEKIIETKTIEEIWEYEHTVLTHLEGIYEAIEVRDAFCVAIREME